MCWQRQGVNMSSAWIGVSAYMASFIALALWKGQLGLARMLMTTTRWVMHVPACQVIPSSSRLGTRIHILLRCMALLVSLALYSAIVPPVQNCQLQFCSQHSCQSHGQITYVFAMWVRLQFCMVGAGDKGCTLAAA